MSATVDRREEEHVPQFHGRIDGVRKLADWIGDLGSIGDHCGRHRQAAETHSRRAHAVERARMSDKCVTVTKLDLKKCFDSVAPIQAIRCWERLGAPGQVHKFLQFFFLNSSSKTGSSVKVRYIPCH